MMIRKPCLPALIALLLMLCRPDARAQADSLIHAHDTARSSDLRARLSAKISLALADDRPGESYAWARKGLAETGGAAGPASATCANLIGAYYKDHGSLDSAAYYYKIALETGRQLGSQRIINGMEANLGQLYGLKGDFPEALKYQLPALAYYESAGAAETHNRYIATTAVGNTYYHMHEPKKALAYFGRIYPALKEGKERIAAGVFTGMALCYGDLGNNVQEEALLQKALAVKKAFGDSLGIANTLNNLGNAAYHRHSNAAALSLYNQALKMAAHLGNKELVDECLQNIATAGVQSGSNADAAIQQFKASLQAAKVTGNLRIRKIALQNLIDAYDSLHDYNTANRYMAEYQQLTDTSASTAYQHEIADAETRYETQRTLRERDRLSYENSLQAAARARAVREKNRAIAIGAGSLAALALIFGLAWRIRNIRARTKEEQSLTRAIFEGEQNERIRIARDLHDSIGQMLSVVKMRLSTMPGLPAADMLASAGISSQLVDKTLEEVRTISHNLIPEDLAFGMVRSLENLCRKIAAAGEVEVLLTVSEEVRARTFTVPFSLSLYRIVQEVLSNMMKHAAATQIKVDMTESSGLIILQIADNGKGFDTGAIGASKGIGWKNIFARVNLLNGNVDVRSERISGTRIEITIPQ